MKQLKALVIVSVLFFALTSEKKAAPTILGYWEIYMTIKDGNTENQRTFGMAFYDGGTLELMNRKRGESIKGKWKLKKDGKVVKISFEDKKLDHGNYTIEALTYDELIIEKNGNKVFFDRGEDTE